MSNYFYEKGDRVFHARKTVMKMKKSIIVLIVMLSLSYFTACSDSGAQDFPLLDESASESDVSDTESAAKDEETLLDKTETEPAVSEPDTIGVQYINNLFYSGDIDVIWNGNGSIGTITGKFTDKTVTSAEDAAELLNSMSALFGSNFHAEALNFSVQEYDTETIYRYSPTVNGAAVSGHQIVLSVTGGEVTYLASTYDSFIESVCTEFEMTGEEAEKTAVSHLLKLNEEFIEALSEESGLPSEEVTDILLDALEIRTEAVITEIPQEEPRLMWSVWLTAKYMYEDNGDVDEYCDWDDIYDYGKYMWSYLSSTYYIGANGDGAGEILYIDNGRHH